MEAQKASFEVIYYRLCVYVNTHLDRTLFFSFDKYFLMFSFSGMRLFPGPTVHNSTALAK